MTDNESMTTVTCSVKWDENASHEKASARWPSPVWDPLRHSVPFCIEIYVKEIKSFSKKRNQNQFARQYEPNKYYSPSVRGLVLKPPLQPSGDSGKSGWSVTLPKVARESGDELEYGLRIISDNDEHDGELRYSRYALHKVPDQEQGASSWIIRDCPLEPVLRFFGFWGVVCAVPGAVLRVPILAEQLKLLEPSDWPRTFYWVGDLLFLPIALFVWTLIVWLFYKPRKAKEEASSEQVNKLDK